MLVYFLTILHVLVCLVLILVVLLQSGKAADLAGAFGGMGSQTAFGPRGAATLLSKATTICAVLFMFTSLTLAMIASRRAGPSSVLERTGKTGQTAPATPAAPGQTAPAAPGQTAPAQPAPQGQQQPAPAQPAQPK